MMRLLLLFSLVVLGYTAKVSYTGHRVYSVYPVTEDHVTVLETMREHAMYNIDFWSSPHLDHKVDVHISPVYEDVFLNILMGQGMNYEVAIEDIQKLIDDVDAQNEAGFFNRDASTHSIVSSFARTAEMDSFMMDLANNYRHCSVSSIGKSFEGRSQYVLKISDGRAGKKSIWVDAGIHAREWLAQSTTIWMMNEIATKYGSDATITDLVTRFDLYFMPNVNPDGYEYSHDADRLWRKTRSTGNSVFCVGTDANRNFDYPVFGGEGTSSSPCSDLYKGPYAFSEPETANLRDFVMSVKDDMAMFLTIHAYYQLLMTPWGYQSARPVDYAELDRVANIGADAIRATHGKRFKVGTPPALLYAAGGGSFDWAKGTAGVKYAYAYELRPAEGSVNGFVIPASEIEPSGQEVLASIVAMANAMKV